VIDPTELHLEALSIIRKCAAKPLDNYPKRIDEMTLTELEIHRICSEAVGRLLFIEELCEKTLRRRV
jgi:hypothetical protein